MTKTEIYHLEENNFGRIYLFQEGMFYKAYEKSAFLLSTLVNPFKVSSRLIKEIGDSIVSIGFPMASLDKFSSGLKRDSSNPPCPGCVVLIIEANLDYSGFVAWKNKQTFCISNKKTSSRGFNNLPVYGKAYRLLLDTTELCSGLDRRFRYSLGEDLRRESKRLVLCVTMAGKGEDKLENIRRSRTSLVEVQLCFRLLNDLKVIPDKRYVPFMSITEDISEQLSKWERFSCQHESTRISPL